ncbi:unnamed protein product [Allacma fusca]|uniref:C2H2-type domain-containing protein n=1 Tax=Allacma fusca TaxID=39272 RepID=A0A8J2LMI2_9HEXA|nr:unnamed protein product [Allacma fusca]
MGNAPFDYYCPSMKSKLQARTCPLCHKYLPSKKAVGTHKKSVHKTSGEDIDETIEFGVRVYAIDEDSSDKIEVISNLEQ